MEPKWKKYSCALEYIYQAKYGNIKIALEHGEYVFAVAFLASEVNLQEAGHSQDTLLWPGVTGGGASTSFEQLLINDGEHKSIKVELNDDNGWG